MSDYKDHCPDCIPLPPTFPMSCIAPLYAAAKAVLSGNPIADPHGTVHCGVTVLAWGAGLYINSEPHARGAVEESSVLRVGCEELAKLAEGRCAVEAIDWKTLFRAVLKLLVTLI